MLHRSDEVKVIDKLSTFTNLFEEGVPHDIYIERNKNKCKNVSKNFSTKGAIIKMHQVFKTKCYHCLRQEKM